MKNLKVSIILNLLFLIEKSFCNPVRGFQPQMIAPPGYIHPGILPMYPMQYPAFPMQHQLSAASSNIDELQTVTPSNQTPVTKDSSKNEEEDDDANKREDDDTFWEAASSYGKNRWSNFKEGFTELWDVFRAAGRGFKSIFTGNE